MLGGAAVGVALLMLVMRLGLGMNVEESRALAEQLAKRVKKSLAPSR